MVAGRTKQAQRNKFRKTTASQGHRRARAMIDQQKFKDGMTHPRQDYFCNFTFWPQKNSRWWQRNYARAPCFFFAFSSQKWHTFFIFVPSGECYFCISMALHFVDRVLVYFVDRISVKSVDHVLKNDWARPTETQRRLPGGNCIPWFKIGPFFNRFLRGSCFCTFSDAINAFEDPK